ncbi:MAG TPA: methyltransferase domain-containing protein [Lautropia sp.]|nr:methyltransferase domain-containing protein [Lautropia sp.]
MSPDDDRTAAAPGPDVDFWQGKFDARTTPWDRGGVSPQMEEWVRTGQLAPLRRDQAQGGSEPGTATRVLVPGCGSGHEVAMLAERGFDVTAVDFAPAAIERTRERLRGLLQSKSGSQVARVEVVEADLLTYEPEERFDAIYEQTCLCALYPDHWRHYADKLFGWLQPGGRLFALFMQSPRDGSRSGFVEGPPYHCDINGMRALFPAERWDWPKPAFPQVAHPSGTAELAVVLSRR